MSESTPAARKISVLLVDDDEDLLAIFSISLKSAGFDVRQASGGNSALRQLDKALPDIVVLDLMMPDCSGFEVLLKLQEKKGPKPPVIVVSGVHKDADTVRRVRMEKIVYDFLFKPVSPSLLADTIRKAAALKAP